LIKIFKNIKDAFIHTRIFAGDLVLNVQIKAVDFKTLIKFLASFQKNLVHTGFPIFFICIDFNRKSSKSKKESVGCSV